MTAFPATAWARRLLHELGVDSTAAAVADAPDSGAVADWAASGAMALTGMAAGPPLVAPGRPATAARGALLALDALAGHSLGVAGHLLLGERAALTGRGRSAPWSVGGACRAVPTADGWVAVSLARESDLELLPALVEGPVTRPPWEVVARWARTRTAQEAAQRGQLLGLPVAPVEDAASGGRLWRITSAKAASTTFSGRPPLVLDLSTLWAGPLCAHLLGLAGACVVRVESSGRPDGGRRGSPRFDALLHARMPSVALDLGSGQGRAQLADLVGVADIVLSSARPRALQQLGVDPEEWVTQSGPGVWVAITAYPPAEDGSTWVGYGDDAAMAAGLVRRLADGTPAPCGDALADPLTGVHAAVAALALWQGGGRHLVRTSLLEVCRAVGGAVPEVEVRSGPGGWLVDTGQAWLPVALPWARPSSGSARPLGADTDAVLLELLQTRTR